MFEDLNNTNQKSAYEDFKANADKRNAELEKKRAEQAAEKTRKQEIAKEREENKEAFSNRLAMFGGGK